MGPRVILGVGCCSFRGMGTDGGAGTTSRSQNLNMNLPFSLMPCGLLPTAGSVPGPSQGPSPHMVRGAW